MSKPTENVAELMTPKFDAPSYTPRALAAKIRRHLRSNLPLIITGSPGSGKTEIVNQVAAEEGYLVWDDGVHAGNWSALDLGGMPWSRQDSDTFEIKRSPLWPSPDETRKVLILIDEVTNCAPENQHVLLRLIHERRIRGKAYGDNIRIIGCGNSETDGTFSGKLSTAFNNRCAHAHLVLDCDQWRAWALSRGVDDRIASYLQWQPDNLSTFKPDMLERAFASPRSWFQLSRDIRANDGEIGDINNIASWIGTGIARQFVAFCEVSTEVIRIEDILKNPLKAPLPDFNRRDLLFATIGHLAARVGVDNIEKVYQYVERLPASYIALFVLDAVRSNKQLFHAPIFSAWCIKYGSDLFA